MRDLTPRATGVRVAGPPVRAGEKSSVASRQILVGCGLVGAKAKTDDGLSTGAKGGARGVGGGP